MRTINLCTCKKCCPVVIELDDGRRAIKETSDGTTIYFNEEQWRNLRKYILSQESDS